MGSEDIRDKVCDWLFKRFNHFKVKTFDQLTPSQQDYWMKLTNEIVDMCYDQFKEDYKD